MRATFVLSAAMWLTLTLPGAADPAACAAMAEPNLRLGCYDDLFRTVTAPEVPGAWSVQVDKSQLDDSTSVYVSLESIEPLRAKFGPPEPARLLLRCKEKVTVAFFVFGGHFMSDNRGGGRIDYRIDTAAAKHRSFGESNDNKALGLWSGKTAIPFLKELMTGQSLYVRATPFNDSMVEAVFPIAGMEAAIKPLREACGW